MSRNALTGVTPGLWRNKRATQTRIHVTERASITRIIVLEWCKARLFLSPECCRFLSIGGKELQFVLQLSRLPGTDGWRVRPAGKDNQRLATPTRSRTRADRQFGPCQCLQAILCHSPVGGGPPFATIRDVGRQRCATGVCAPVRRVWQGLCWTHRRRRHDRHPHRRGATPSAGARRSLLAGGVARHFFFPFCFLVAAAAGVWSLGNLDTLG